MDKISKKNQMITNRIKVLREKFKDLEIDGYIIPKNDEFFSEYAQNDRLKNISNFTGSAGLAIILKKNNYLFVDGRYTIQAENESGKNFKIIEIHKIYQVQLSRTVNWVLTHMYSHQKKLKIIFQITPP